MSGFADIFAAGAAPVLLEQNGETVTYLDPDADPVDLTAIVGPEESDLEEGEGGGGSVKKRRRRVTVARDPTAATGGVATPGEGKAVTIDGENWTIEAVESMSATLACLRCVRPVSVEPSKPHYRGR
jgi:hypothetical protein